MPTAGDFVARGLGPGVQAALDRWLTRWIVPHRADVGWPKHGLRGIIAAGQAPVALSIHQSCDAVGRDFVLVAVCTAQGGSRAAIDAWAEKVLPPLNAAANGTLNSADLLDALSGICLADDGGKALAPPTLWYPGGEPGAVDEVLAAVFD